MNDIVLTINGVVGDKVFLSANDGEKMTVGVVIQMREGLVLTNNLTVGQVLENGGRIVYPEQK